MLKKNYYYLIILMFCIPFQILTKETGYYYNPLVPIDLWLQLEPYFIPLNHPIKTKLDRIFKAKRVTQSKTSFQEAGFGKIKMRHPTNIVVGRHPSLQGYLVKVYLDTQPAVGEWINWIKRIQGAWSIQNCIEKHGYKHFKVPQKWIYPLPFEPSPPANEAYHRKNFILVVEDMRILESKKNLQAYSKNITPQILDELYVILTEEGLIDSIFPDNIPFTKDGKLAFIDTEHHHQWPVNYEKLNHYFSLPMQAYWINLTKP